MQKRTKLFSFIFFIVFALQVIGEYTDNISLRFFSKPLIVIVLLIWLFMVTNLKDPFDKRIFTGLICALTGDVLLMLQGNNPSFFMFGLVAFLFCHIFYIRAFILDYKSASSAKNPFLLWAVFVFALFCAGLFFYLQPNLGEMQYPVLIYAIIISVMAIMAVSRYGRVNLLSFEIIFYGALFFLFSDSMLAYNKFVGPLPQAGVIIMSSYMLAQYLIVFGTLERKLLVTSKASSLSGLQ